MSRHVSTLPRPTLTKEYFYHAGALSRRDVVIQLLAGGRENAAVSRAISDSPRILKRNGAGSGGLRWTDRDYDGLISGEREAAVVFAEDGFHPRLTLEVWWEMSL